MVEIRDYLDVSRRWSLLRYIASTVLAGEGLTCTPEAIDSSSCFAWYPQGNSRRPAVFCERVAGSLRSVSVGASGRQHTFTVGILAGVWNDDGTARNANALLEIWCERLYHGLHGKKIPFYDYRDEAAPLRLAGHDFEPRYQSDARESEQQQGDKNVLVMRWGVQV